MSQESKPKNKQQAKQKAGDIDLAAVQAEDKAKGIERKWARKQLDKPKHYNTQKPEGANEYNIWYDRWEGDTHQVRDRASTRCMPQLDQGLTKADLLNPGHAFICLHFARGDCHLGAECHFLHRLPKPEDEGVRVDPMHDVFGRTRHASDKDDMGGVGCFWRDNRTLYVTNLYMPDLVKDNGERARAAVEKHFACWGEIEKIDVKPKHGCIFVRYKNRICAEFAKIAMADQPLENGEQVNVRWAYDDPNPAAIKRIQRERERETFEAVLKKEELDEQFEAYLQNQDSSEDPPKAAIPLIGPALPSAPSNKRSREEIGPQMNSHNNNNSNSTTAVNPIKMYDDWFNSCGRLLQADTLNPNVYWWWNSHLNKYELYPYPVPQPPAGWTPPVPPSGPSGPSGSSSSNDSGGSVVSVAANGVSTSEDQLQGSGLTLHPNELNKTSNEPQSEPAPTPIQEPPPSSDFKNDLPLDPATAEQISALAEMNALLDKIDSNKRAKTKS